jgi:hypothetical protein
LSGPGGNGNGFGAGGAGGTSLISIGVPTVHPPGSGAGGQVILQYIVS